jgi:hypothetical protein
LLEWNSGDLSRFQGSVEKLGAGHTARVHNVELKQGTFLSAALVSSGLGDREKLQALGWTADNKVIRPIDALEHGLIEISDLQTFPTYATG